MIIKYPIFLCLQRVLPGYESIFLLAKLYIVTASDIHKEIQKICSPHANCPPIRVQHLADQLDGDKQLIASHIESLATLGLIEYQDEAREVFVLTVSGKLATLPS